MEEKEQLYFVKLENKVGFFHFIKVDTYSYNRSRMSEPPTKRKERKIRGNTRTH